MSFENKVIIITGASSGIGEGTALHLAKKGAHIVLVGRNIDKLNNVAHAIKALTASKPLVVQADVTITSDNERIITKTLEEFGKIDILVNNAGIIAVGSIEQTSMEQYDSVMNTNMRSVYHLTMLAVPYLIHTKGNIVNVSSVNGIRAFAGVLAYNISKAALDQFTRCVALELAPKKIRVNSVNPGVIVTEIHKRGGMSDVEYNAFLERSKSTHALGRPGTVEEVAEAIEFLASEKASFTTGLTLSVDGGRHAMCPR